MNTTILTIAINADYSALTNKFEMNPRAPKFKVGYRVRINKYKNILAKVTPKIVRVKFLLLILC